VIILTDKKFKVKERIAMNIYLNKEKLETHSNNKSEIIEIINSKLGEEIIEKIYLDEVEVEYNYFLNNDLDLERFDEINFVSKDVNKLITESLQEAEIYLPKLKQGLIESSQLFKTGDYNKANEIFNRAVDGLEWYLNILNSIIDLKEDTTVEEVEGLLKKFNMALNRAMISLNKKEYNNFADLLEVEIIEYLDKLQSYHQELVEEN